MSSVPRPIARKTLTRWLPLLERLEQRETPTVTVGLSQVATWTELGPNVISEGQTRGIDNVPSPNGGLVDNPVIGAVQALAAHPTNPNIMFAAGVNGGVWRTTNAQAASPFWVPISDEVASLSISDMALDPSDPNKLLVGIGGTADGADVDPSGVVRGDLIGLLYTENALAPTPTWTIINNGLANKNITNVFLRPATGVAPNIVPAYMLVATDSGLYRSDDGGATFTNVFTATTNNGVTFFTRVFSEGVYDLAENPRLRDQFYVATKPNGAFGRQVWRTDDGGLTWGTVTDPQMQLNDRTVNVQLTVRDAGASDNQVYVAVSNNHPSTGAEQSTPGMGFQYAWEQRDGVLTSVCWSTNQGGNWTRMDAPRQETAPNVANVTYNTTTGVVTVSTSPEHRLQSGDKIRLSGGITRVWTELPDAPDPDPPNGPGPIVIDGYYLVDVTSPTSFTLRGFAVSPVGGTGRFSTFGNPPGQWRRVVGANPGENGEFLQILASRTNQELVYLGGDMSQWNFFNNNGPTTFTGTYWEGNRFSDPLGPDADQSNSAQWTTLTDTGTNVPNNTGRTAPGADTREMIYDANGTLWVGTGTGVYRRSDLTTSGGWNSANGNIRLGQFWSTSYDAFTNTAVGAMQDTGQVEQNFNSTGWHSLLGNGGRNILYDQENAYTSFVDNSQSANPNPLLRRSVRFALGNSFSNVNRTVTDANGSSTSQLFFGSPSNPTGGLSGITNGADLSPTNKTSIVLALNANDQRRGVYALNGVYEDSDPNGITGRIVNTVTPPGMTGLVRAMAYGGKRIINGTPTSFNQVLWIGTSTGQLWIRGEFGVTFTLRSPGAPGTAVTDIELDPDDWRHAFILQNNRVYETTDAGTTFTDVSANLSTPPSPVNGLPTGTGLTTAVQTIALYDPNPGTTAGGVTLLAGGRGGVFRLATSACGTTNAWAEYGVGLPNTVVQDLEVTGNRLLAGTFGRGAWVVPDVSPTLNNTIYLDITGDAAANTISIEADPLNPNGVIVDDGLGNRQAFTFGQFTAIRVTTGGGADTIRIDSNGAAAGGTTNFINYPVLVDAGGDAGDLIVINDEGAATNVRTTITGADVGAGPADTLFGGCGTLTYSGLGNGTLLINTGTGNDVFVVEAGTMARATVLNTGAGDDNTYLDGSAVGSVYLNDTTGTDSATVSVPADQTVIANTQFRQVAVLGLNLIYGAGVESVLLDGLAAGSNLAWFGTPAGDSVYLMQDPLLPATWSQLLSPANTIRFHNMKTVGVNTLGGADGLVVDSNATGGGGTTKFVTYAVTANMGGDAGDSLEINDSGTAANTRADITPTTIGAIASVDNLFGSGGGLTYLGLGAGGARLSTGGGNDLLVFDAATALNIDVNFGGGAGDELWVNGTAGNDSVLVNNTSVVANALNVVAAAGVNQFTVYGNGGFDTFTNIGSAASENLGVYQTGALGGLLTGFPVPARYEGVEALSLNGGGGTNSLSWTDYTSLTYGTPTDPDSGVVYIPTGPLSGELRVNFGQVTTTRFSNVAGSFVVNGDPLADGTRDVITVYGLSDGELGAPSGADVITATDTGVSIANASLGGLRGISFGPSGALTSFSTVYVKGGNEAGQGDFVSATTTTRTNLILDGGNPTSAPGDFIAVTTQGQASSAFVNDPALGPPHTRITDRVTGGAVGYLNFEGVSATFISPVTGTPVSSFNPPIARLFAVASDAGVPVEVKVFNADGSQRFPSLFPFGGFSGGARVAVGDVTGDGTYDIVVSAGPGAAPHVKVFDGVSGAEVMSFFAYSPAFNGGVSVAVAYFNADGFADIVIGAGPGGGPHVKVIDGRTGGELQSFFAFAPAFTNGVNVAAGDFGGDGTADIVVGAGPGGGPHVKVFDGQSGAELHSFFAYDASFSGGVNVAAGDITGDGRADIITGAGSGGSAHVKVFDGRTGQEIRSFIVNDPTIPGQPPISLSSGVRVSAADLDGDGLAEVMTGRGPGSRPFAQFLRVSTPNGSGGAFPTLDSLLAVNVFGDAYSGGIYVGG